MNKNGEVMDDFRMILKDRSLLKKFLVIDDINEMYLFCKNLNEKSKYSEEEFCKEVQNLINSLPNDFFDDCEW